MIHLSIGVNTGLKRKKQGMLLTVQKSKMLFESSISFIGNIPIRDIKPDHIDTLLNSLTEKNPSTQRPTSKQYLIDVRNTAFDVFESAIDNNAIGKNPARKREISKYAPKRYRRALSQTEQKLIVVTPHRARIGALIMMLAGLRRGELIPLTWDDIDLDDFTIHVTKSVEEKRTNHFTIKSGTKTSWGRNISIPLDLAIEIETAKKESSSPYVCPRCNGDMHSPTSWRRMWNNYINTIIKTNKYASHTKIKEITSHYLRHTYATLLYISGVDVVTASKLLGHSNIKTTVEIYTHLDELMLKKSVDKLDDYVSRNLFPNRA